MSRLGFACAIAVFAASSALASARITFERTITPPRSLGSNVQDLLIAYAIGDNDRIATFIDVFLDQARYDAQAEK